MTELEATQAALSRVRGQAAARPDCERLHAVELELTVRALRLENKLLRAALARRRPILVRRVA